MGCVVFGGAPEITGVVFFSGTSTSVALHDAKKITPQTSPAVRMNLYVCRFIINSQIHRRRVRFVRWGALHQGRGTHPPPIVRDPRACTAQYRRDETRCFSSRLVYRRLDTSSLRTLNSPLKTLNSPFRTRNSPLRTRNSPLRTRNSPLRTRNF